MSGRHLIPATFGPGLRCFRGVKKLTKEALPERAGLDRTSIIRIERGLRGPGVKNVVSLAEGLGLATAKLMEGEDG